MNRAKFLKLLVLAMVLLIVSSSVFAETPQNTRTVLDLFLEPDVRAKPMARMWFPDAGAGEDDSDLIEKQISELAAKGFGGVEVAMLMSGGVRYFNDDARIYGWGTDNWIRLLKKVLKAAVRIADVVIIPGENGGDDQISYVFDFGSLIPITAGVEAIPGAGYPAGL